MSNRVFAATLIFFCGAAFGSLTTNLPLASASSQALPKDPSEITFVVSIDEIAQNFVFGDRFTGSYEKTVTMSDGSERDIVLTPMEKDGQLTVKFPNGRGHTYMGPNGWTYNGELLVSLRNHDQVGLCPIKQRIRT